MTNSLEMTLRVWSWSWYQNPPAVLWLGNVALILMGSVAVWLSGRGRGRRLGRVGYVMGLGLAGLVLALSQAWWQFYAPALRLGLEGLLTLADVLACLTFGAVMRVLGMARSQDVYGTAVKGWYGLIPLLNLALTFKAGRVEGAAPRRSDLTAALVLFFLFAAFTRSITAEVEAVVTRANAQLQADDAAVAALREIHLHAIGLDAALDELLAAEVFPRRLSEGLEFTSAGREGARLIYTYTLDDTGALGDDFSTANTQAFCGALLPYLNLGATASIRYLTRDGVEVVALPLSLVGCTA